MKKKCALIIVTVLALTLTACGNTAEDTVSKTEYDTIVSKLNDAEEKQTQLQTELESVQAELNALKESVAESKLNPETKVEEVIEIKEDEGLTVATEPITVPDPSAQSEFVVEVTAENFLSIFEFIAIDQYDTWGEYDGKDVGFSSLLYEQGWAIGKVEDFSVEYSAFDSSKTTGTTPFGIINRSIKDKNQEMNLHIYRAKGTLTFYPVDAVDDNRVDCGSFISVDRELPDDSVLMFLTDPEGIMVY